MATLYDLELQESNNFIHPLMQNGVTPALTLLSQQREMAVGMGDTGKEMLAQFDDQNSEIGKAFFRLQALQKDIVATMEQVGLTQDLAKAAQDIFAKSPESLSVLPEPDRVTISSYWLKKKACIVVLLKKGYTHEELFS